MYGPKITPNIATKRSKRSKSLERIVNKPPLKVDKMGIIIDTPSQPPILSTFNDTNNQESNLISLNPDINNWNQENLNTITTWKNNLEKSIYIYSYISDKTNKILHQFLILSLIASTLTTLLSSITTALLSTDDNKPSQDVNTGHLKTNFWMSGTQFLFSAVNVVLIGAIKVYKWDSISAALSKYIEKLNTLYYTISHELLLPLNSRTDATDFIIKHSNSFLELLQNCPDVDVKQYTKAEQSYKTYKQKVITN